MLTSTSLRSLFGLASKRLLYARSATQCNYCTVLSSRIYSVFPRSMSSSNVLPKMLCSPSNVMSITMPMRCHSTSHFDSEMDEVHLNEVVSGVMDDFEVEDVKPSETNEMDEEQVDFMAIVEKANDGDSDAMAKVGLAYLKGKHGAPRNYDKACDYFYRSANLGNVKGLFQSGVCARYGYGRDINLNAAIGFWEEAAQQQHGQSYTALGSLYYNGNGVEKDAEKAFECFQQAANFNDGAGHFYVGRFYTEAKKMNRDLEQGLYHFRKAAELGYAPAVLALGLSYTFGRGVPQDRVKAFQLFNKAYSIKPMSELCHRLGWSYMNGVGVAKDEQLAVKFLKEGVEKKHGRCCQLLAGLYREGRVVATEPNMTEAVNFYLLGAQHGDAVCHYEIGRAYSQGIWGLEQNYTKANHHLRIAANYNADTALALLAEHYLKGLGTAVDVTKALDLLKRGVHNKGYHCALQLGILYHRGLKVRKDLFEAKGLFLSALNWGSTEAKSHLESLEKDLERKRKSIINNNPRPPPRFR